MYRALPMFFGILLWTSCDDKPDEATPLTEADLIGSWNIDQMDADLMVTGDLNGTPVDDKFTTSITGSALRMELRRDGSWTSDGDYTLVSATNGGDPDTAVFVGMGGGSWRFAADTLYLSGMDSNENGRFDPEHAWYISAFRRDVDAVAETTMDITETEADLNITLRTYGNMRMELVR